MRLLAVLRARAAFEAVVAASLAPAFKVESFPRAVAPKYARHILPVGVPPRFKFGLSRVALLAVFAVAANTHQRIFPANNGAAKPRQAACEPRRVIDRALFEAAVLVVGRRSHALLGAALVGVRSLESARLGATLAVLLAALPLPLNAKVEARRVSAPPVVFAVPL